MRLRATETPSATPMPVCPTPTAAAAAAISAWMVEALVASTSTSPTLLSGGAEGRVVDVGFGRPRNVVGRGRPTASDGKAVLAGCDGNGGSRGDCLDLVAADGLRQVAGMHRDVAAIGGQAGDAGDVARDIAVDVVERERQADRHRGRILREGRGYRRGKDGCMDFAGVARLDVDAAAGMHRLGRCPGRHRCRRRRR